MEEKCKEETKIRLLSLWTELQSSSSVLAQEKIFREEKRSLYNRWTLALQKRYKEEAWWASCHRKSLERCEVALPRIKFQETRNTCQKQGTWFSRQQCVSRPEQWQQAWMELKEFAASTELKSQTLPLSRPYRAYVDDLIASLYTSHSFRIDLSDYRADEEALSFAFWYQLYESQQLSVRPPFPKFAAVSLFAKNPALLVMLISLCVRQAAGFGFRLKQLSLAATASQKIGLSVLARRQSDSAAAATSVRSTLKSGIKAAALGTLFLGAAPLVPATAAAELGSGVVTVAPDSFSVRAVPTGVTTAAQREGDEGSSLKIARVSPVSETVALKSLKTRVTEALSSIYPLIQKEFGSATETQKLDKMIGSWLVNLTSSTDLPQGIIPLSANPNALAELIQALDGQNASMFSLPYVIFDHLLTAIKAGLTSTGDQRKADIESLLVGTMYSFHLKKIFEGASRSIASASAVDPTAEIKAAMLDLRDSEIIDLLGEEMSEFEKLFKYEIEKGEITPMRISAIAGEINNAAQSRFGTDLDKVIKIFVDTVTQARKNAEELARQKGQTKALKSVIENPAPDLDKVESFLDNLVNILDKIGVIGAVLVALVATTRIPLHCGRSRASGTPGAASSSAGPPSAVATSAFASLPARVPPEKKPVAPVVADIEKFNQAFAKYRDKIGQWGWRKIAAQFLDETEEKNNVLEELDKKGLIKFLNEKRVWEEGKRGKFLRYLLDHYTNLSFTKGNKDALEMFCFLTTNGEREDKDCLINPLPFAPPLSR